MKALWTRQARRIDALSLRERVIMFVSLVVALGAVADGLVLSPQMAAQKAMATQLRQQGAELDALRVRLAAVQAGGADTPQARLQQTLDETRAERRTVDAELQRRGSLQGGAATLPELLERVLRRHQRLTLLQLATAAPPAPPREGAPPAVLPWQGVDLQLSGSYVDLVAYLAETEAALPGLRWSALQLSSQTLPPVLKVRVYLHARTGDLR